MMRTSKCLHQDFNGGSGEKNKVYLTDEEIHISGPNECVDGVIKLSKSTYAAFGISEYED